VGSPRRLVIAEVLDRMLEGAALSGARVEKIVLNEADFQACRSARMRQDRRLRYQGRHGMASIAAGDADAIILATADIFCQCKRPSQDDE